MGLIKIRLHSNYSEEILPHWYETHFYLHLVESVEASVLHLSRNVYLHTLIWRLLSKDQTATFKLKKKIKYRNEEKKTDSTGCELWSRPPRGYTRLNSFRLCRRMVSLTATKTKRMFSVSVAQVKCGYSVLSLSGFCSWYIFRMNSWAEFGSCWGPAQSGWNHQTTGLVSGPPPVAFGQHRRVIHAKYFEPRLLELIMGLQYCTPFRRGAVAAKQCCHIKWLRWYWLNNNIITD